MEIKEYLNNQKQRVEEALEKSIPKPSEPFAHHIEAMRYSLFAGGKRIRPILCLAAATTINEDPAVADDLMPICCALECIHTYSLIHDDLPAMDDDDLRRGKPTNHILFGEAGAILAGDGLLTLAFELICSSEKSSSLNTEQRLKIAHLVAIAAGSFGMVGGQSLDIAHEKQDYPFDMLQTIHRSKTGALITASVHCGAVAAAANSQQTEALLEYGRQIGLAFQIVDDLLDVTSTTAKLGKQAGNDEAHGKATYPAFCGIEETRKRARLAVSGAKQAISNFDGKAEPLRLLADYIYERSH